MKKIIFSFAILFFFSATVLTQTVQTYFPENYSKSEPANIIYFEWQDIGYQSSWVVSVEQISPIGQPINVTFIYEPGTQVVEGRFFWGFPPYDHLPKLLANTRYRWQVSVTIRPPDGKVKNIVSEPHYFTTEK